MSKIIYKTGNLIEASERYIMHGCNAQGVMGSGVAKAIREEWPDAYEEYAAYIIEAKRLRTHPLGTIQVSIVKPSEYNVDKYSNQYIINAITQDYYGRDGSRFVSYDALENCFSLVENRFPGKSIAMPKIGAGLGGGDWDIISTIMEDTFKTVQPVVYELLNVNNS